ncbi:hypothetical protein [Haloarchaeobius litoreus]|uniref:Uncharacterized protein n=1 Tax=Haloarchaeobius litoreus TaxID=755306 RepID=A0ABD6DJU2_9EURY|nr:hypothetical protein [Haloarchaeobius litoreus]
MTRTIALLAVAGVLAWVLLGDDPAPAVADRSSLSEIFTPDQIEDLRQLNEEEAAGEGFEAGTRAALVGEQVEGGLQTGATGL